MNSKCFDRPIKLNVIKKLGNLQKITYRCDSSKPHEKPILNLSKALFIFHIIKQMMYLRSYWSDYSKNRKYIKGKKLNVPPPHLMYEVFGTNIENYVISGYEVAAFIANKFLAHGLSNNTNVLDLGCGVGRITFNLPKYLEATIYGCDINQEMIQWCQSIQGKIIFAHQKSRTKLPYNKDLFAGIVVLSIITHTSEDDIDQFIDELYRVSAANGLVFITTQGQSFIPRLLDSEKAIYEATGKYYRAIGPKGDRFYSSYHSKQHIETLIAGKFTIVEHIEGNNNKDRPAQDIYLLRCIKV